MKKHILLIENSEEKVEFFTEALEESHLNFLCSRARNAEQAIKILKNIVPDIIFLDANLPKNSGSEFLKNIKAKDYMQNVPVIMYSTIAGKNTNESNKNDAQYMLLPRNVHKMANLILNAINDADNNVGTTLKAKIDVQ